MLEEDCEIHFAISMNVRNRRTGWFAAGLITTAGIFPALSELPVMHEKEWLGYFVGFENKKFQFGIPSKGKAKIRVIGKTDKPIQNALSIPVDFVIEEIKPNGTTSVRTIRPETLESAQPATLKPKGIVFRGKVNGDATFEVFVDEEGGVISLGGRLLDVGKLTTNPLRFSIQLKIPNAYPSVKKVGDKRLVKAFEDKIKRDRLQLTWTDGKHLKQHTDKPVDASSKEINGPGIAAAQVEFSTMAEKRIEVAATTNSSIALSNPQLAPLNEGFSIIWTADPAKDPEGKARFNITVK
jgi:hypothetical protein